MKCRSFLRMAKNVMHWNPPFSCQFEIQFCQGVDPERVQYFLHGPTAALYMRSRTKVQHRAVTEGPQVELVNPLVWLVEKQGSRGGEVSCWISPGRSRVAFWGKRRV